MKQKKCKQCKEPFTPERQMQSCCSYGCAIEYSKASKLKSDKSNKRKALKAFSDSDIATLKRKAQTMFNQYIRLRDGKKCISCGYEGEGRKFDAGHYKSQGGNSALRYDENNVHAQCVQCNQFRSGNLAEYRKNLIIKIGEEEVIRLETDKNTKRWTVEELHEIINAYKQKIKDINEK